jgi:hypothetical protein
MLKKRPYNLIYKIWNNEKISIGWSEGIIWPIFKKGDPKNCENYRGIVLLNISYKIFAILIYNKLREMNEPMISDCQMGFGPNRSTTIDNIYTIKQIYEKYYEYSI